MKKNLSLLFFCISQGALFFFLKNFGSFAESKWILALLESFLVLVTVLWYVFSNVEASNPLPVTMMRPAIEDKEEEEGVLEEVQKEKDTLESTLKRLEESELFLKQRLQDAEHDKQQIQDNLEEIQDQLTFAQEKKSSSTLTIGQLTHELEKMREQIEQERREHAIEVRALLRKDDHLPLTKKEPYVPKVEMNPVPAVLLMLATCYKGLEKQGEWPSQEHRLLLRRKFFDVIRKSENIPLAVFSLDHSSDMYISPLISEHICILDMQAILTSKKGSLKTLETYEPYYLSDTRLSTERWVMFRVSWENLDDLVVLTYQPVPEQAQKKM